MELGASRRGNRFSSYERLAAIGLVILAVASPLYIGQQQESELEDEEQPVNIDVRLPLLLFLLILGIALSASMDRSFTAGFEFDRYWIHRVCGSSGGIVVILTILFLILKCKSSL